MKTGNGHNENRAERRVFVCLTEMGKIATEEYSFYFQHYLPLKHCGDGGWKLNTTRTGQKEEWVCVWLWCERCPQKTRQFLFATFSFVKPLWRLKTGTGHGENRTKRRVFVCVFDGVAEDAHRKIDSFYSQNFLPLKHCDDWKRALDTTKSIQKEECLFDGDAEDAHRPDSFYSQPFLPLKHCGD